MKKAQFQIQQMAFMILAVFFLFILVGMFFLNYQIRSIRSSYANLQKEETIASLQTIANMPEFAWTYESDCYLCLDEDKLLVMTGEDYSQLWPIDSIEIKKIYPYEENKKCPAQDCNYYKIYDSGQMNIEKYATYVSLCRRNKEFDYVYDKCEIAKLIVGYGKSK